MEEGSRAVAVGMAVAIVRLGAVKGFESSPMSFLELSLGQCSQRGSPSVLSQDEDGRQLVVPSGHFLKLPGK